MKISFASSSQALGQIGLALAVFAVASCAAGDLTSAQTIARPPMPLTTAIATPAGDVHCADVAPAQTLFLEKAGDSIRLGYFSGCGWKYFREDIKVAHTMAQSAMSTPATPDPMAVFIDGPSGYAFAWTVEAGWEFIGHVTDANTELHPTRLLTSQR
jgi:hypothetical protein